MLVAGRIKFTPDFPRRQLDAAAKLRLGSLDRIALEIQDNPLGLSRDDIVIEKSDSTRTACVAPIWRLLALLIDVAGYSAAIFRPGRGRDGRLRQRMAEKDVWRRCRCCRQAIADPPELSAFMQGATSSEPPATRAREKSSLSRSAATFFAGEAAHEPLSGTVDGAWESGERAAEAALRRIGALKDEPAPAQQQRRRTELRNPSEAE